MPYIQAEFNQENFKLTGLSKHTDDGGTIWKVSDKEADVAITWWIEKKAKKIKKLKEKIAKAHARSYDPVFYPAQYMNQFKELCCLEDQLKKLQGENKQ